MGIITQRRKKRQAARVRRGLMKWIAAAAACAALFFAEPAWRRIAPWASGVQVFSQPVHQDMTLPEYDVYALQLAVFDSGERAASSAQQLQREGVRCVVWQREKMRIVADVAFSRDALDSSRAGGHEAYVIRDTLPEISLRLSGAQDDAERAKKLLEMPDQLLGKILQSRGTPLQEIIAQVRADAEEALSGRLEHALYTQLAQSLVNWCDLMEETIGEENESAARSYGALTMCTLCRELRQALSASSTASAQRTPSTAADVMPPA